MSYHIKKINIVSKLCKFALAVTLCLTFSSTTFAAVVITDAGFDAAFTDIGDNPLTNTLGDFDKWVYFNDRSWQQVSTGGNPSGYADGALNGNNYIRTLYQGVTDNKSNTGIHDFTFDLNLLDGGADNGPLTANIWGVQNLAGASFSLTTRNQAGVTSGDATILATQDFTTDTTGWESQMISNVDLGTGYDLIIIGFRSVQHDQTDPDILGIDNVALTAIPEPSSFSLISLGLGALFVLRRRIAK